MGTTVNADVVRVVDGDTIRVDLDGNEESLRILALDTEESSASSSKPETPFGHAAKAKAKELVEPGDTLTLEFPGDEPLDECLRKYRGNYGRPLVFVDLPDGTDYQEHMIEQGFSPYFVKYGYAAIASRHARYVAAERRAQTAVDAEGTIGVWNQLRVNGFEARNYAALGTWWHLRAEVIQAYRQLSKDGLQPPLLNSRLDFERIEALAQQNAEVTVFTELRSHERVGQRHAVVKIGSLRQPFQLFIRNADEEPGQSVLRLLNSRYVAGGEDHPRRSYAYVAGELKMFGGVPEIDVQDPARITDAFAS